MKESTARIGDGRTDGRTLTTGLEVNAFRAVGRKSKRSVSLVLYLDQMCREISINENNIL